MGEEVLRQLIDAVRAGDGRALRAVCLAHDRAIRDAFPHWRRVPDDVRADPQRTQWYARTLLAIAHTFERSGDASLLAALLGPESDNPITRWQSANEAARAAIVERRYRDAELTASAALREFGGFTSPDADVLRAITSATFGEALFHLGRVGAARAHFEGAVEACLRAKDMDGVVAYTSSLIEVHRWLGEPSHAAVAADRAANTLDVAGQLGRATALRKRAAALRRPEPLVRVMLETEDGIFEERDVDPAVARGRVRFFFQRNRPEVGEATRLVDEGKRRGAEGDHEGALTAFDEAAGVDPHDPRAPYLAGLALMHLGRYAEARARYDRTEALAPGWYQCRTDRWLAGKLAAGHVDHGVLDALARGDDEACPSDALLAAVRPAIARHPIAPLYLLEAKAHAAVGRTGDAERAARAGLACAEEADVRTRLLVRLASLVADPERGRLLEEATALEGNLVAAAMARVMLAAR